MRRLNELADKMRDITLGDMPEKYLDGDLYEYLQEFFSRPEVQEALVVANQRQMFYQWVNRNGMGMGNYSKDTAAQKMNDGLPSVGFTFYQTGAFYASMGVHAGEESVAITSCDIPLGIDDINHWGVTATPVESNIYDMFATYDKNGYALGLTDENFDNFVEESDMKGEIVKRLKEYLNG